MLGALEVDERYFRGPRNKVYIYDDLSLGEMKTFKSAEPPITSYTFFPPPAPSPMCYTVLRSRSRPELVLLVGAGSKIDR